MVTEGFQIALHPVVSGDGSGLIEGHAAGHRQKMAHGEIFLPDKAKKAYIFPENIHDFCIQRKFSFRDQKPDSHGSHTLAHGVSGMPELLSIGIKSRLPNDFTAFQDHHRMHVQFFGRLQSPKKLLNLP